jgi:sarcosine oxidase, subunit beta
LENQSQAMAADARCVSKPLIDFASRPCKLGKEVRMGRYVVVGGGITGCAAAWTLACSGHRVRLFEQHHIAAMASGWTLGGVRQSGRHPAELPLAKAAVSLWPGLADRLGHETGYFQHGNLRLARTADEAKVIRKLVDEQNRQGLELIFLDGSDAVRAVSPSISETVVAASYCATDGFADPVATTSAFARAARQHGASIETGVRVEQIVMRKGRIFGVETSRGFAEADGVIVAAGTHSPGLLASLGLVLPLSVTLVQVVQTEPAPPSFDQVFGVANADCAGRQEPDGRFRFTSGVTMFQVNADSWTEAGLAPSAADVAALRDRVGNVLPSAAATPVARSWGGLIDLTPDHLQVIDAPATHPGLMVAAGFSGHGFGIGPVTGSLAAALAMGTAPAHDLLAFSLARFCGHGAASQPVALHG